MTFRTGDAAAQAETQEVSADPTPDADDVTRRDALERTIRYRLPMCDERELRAIDACLMRLERDRADLAIAVEEWKSGPYDPEDPACAAAEDWELLVEDLDEAYDDLEIPLEHGGEA